jgi:hypothetical protein
MDIEYTSNNSGGRWWLKDEDWRALEEADWTVQWVKDEPPTGFRDGDSSDRWLGALAMRASKSFETPAEAIREFERVTGQKATDEGCNCCGAPHTFSWSVRGQHEYASGEGCIKYLFGDDAPLTLREAIERAR